MNRGVAVRLLVAAALGVAWAVAAVLLWRSRVPDDLRLGAIPLEELFTPDQLRRAARFERFERLSFVLSQVALLGALTFWALRGERWTRESAAGRVGTGILLGLLGLAVAWLSQLPFAIADAWWERRYGIVRTGWFDILFDTWFGLGVQFVSIALTLAIVMGLAAVLPRLWWLPAAMVFVALGASFVFLYPYSVETHGLRDRDLRADARRFERAQRLDHVPVVVEEVHNDVSVPNATAIGLGPSRRVIVWDTLLDRRFSRPQIDVVLAHEFAHHSRRHLPKGIAWYALFAVPGVYLIALATRRRGGMRSPAAVPLSLVIVATLQLAALPFESTISRHVEAEADWVALETTRDPRAAEQLFGKFTTLALEQPRPPGWAAFVLANHPTIEDRIAMARAWRERLRQRVLRP